jgi:hypothetical protein
MWPVFHWGLVVSIAFIVTMVFTTPLWLNVEHAFVELVSLETHVLSAVALSMGRIFA